MAEPTRISDEEYEGWLSPLEATNELPNHLGWAAKIGALTRPMLDGTIRTAARRVVGPRGATQYLELIPKFWVGTDLDSEDGWGDFWHQGRFEVMLSDDPDVTRLYGIRLEREGVLEIVRELTPRPPLALAASMQAWDAAHAPEPQDSSKAVPQIDAFVGPSFPGLTEGDAIRYHMGGAGPDAPKHGGGRPAHPYWEEAVLTIAHRMHLGDFKPQRQAEVATALAEWIVAQGHPEPGATQLKVRAKLVFGLFKD